MVLAAGSLVSADLLFSLNHNDLPSSGAITTWDGTTAMGAPTVANLDGVNWVNNSYSSGTGFLQGHYTNAIPINGASIVVAIDPTRNTSSTPWTSVVDIFYNQLVLGVHNDTGQVVVRSKTALYNSTATIADGQKTILSLVLQADGSFKVWANGVQMMDQAAGTFWSDAGGISGVQNGGMMSTAMSSLDPNALTGVNYGTNPWTLNSLPFAQYINIGRNNPDGWTAFNGLIGDTYVYTNALSDADRISLEANIASSMGMASVPEPASILAMLSGLVGLAGFAIRRKK
jgi:hypothetical protein